jgi:glycosyltransferase involved in cell wall biosynthesis
MHVMVANGARRDLRILFITGGAPWPTTLGVNQRTNLLLRALKRCGVVDTVIHTCGTHMSESDMGYLRDHYGVIARFVRRTPGERWPYRLIGKLSPSMASRLGVHLGGMKLSYQPQHDIAHWLARRMGERPYDLIVGRYLRVLASSGALAYRPIVLDLDDYDCATQRSRLQQPGLSIASRFAVKRQVRQVENVVPKLLRQCDHLWIASRADQPLLRAFPTSILPNIPFEDEGAERAPRCAPRPESKSVLMVGSLRHTVNVTATEQFVRAVWPRVHARVPGSQFRIVGYGMTDDQKRRWGAVSGVVPVGFVDDLTEEYDRSAFTVAPIFEGGGTKIKVLESLRYGRTVLATAHAHRGYESVLRHGEELWVAPDEEALAEGCVRLLTDPDLRGRMAQAGADAVARHYSYESFAEVVGETVHRVAATRREQPGRSA